MPVRETLVEIYETVVRLLEDENDGIRTQAVRVVEEFVTFKNEDFSLFDNAILTLTDFLKKATISNGNLVAGLTSLSRIAKTEADYISTVISEFENLNASLPPTLSITQVKNVRKLIRIQLIDLFKSCPEMAEHNEDKSAKLKIFSFLTPSFAARFQLRFVEQIIVEYKRPTYWSFYPAGLNLKIIINFNLYLHDAKPRFAILASLRAALLCVSEMTN